MLPRRAPLETLESYYDAAPRPHARTEEVGRFTLFVQTDPASWPYYARPRRNGVAADHLFTPADVAEVRTRQRELEVPEAIEWVHQVTPSLLQAARADGMQVAECPLLVHTGAPEVAVSGVRIEVLGAESPDVGTVAGAVGAAFRGVDDLLPSEPGSLPEAIRAGTLVMVGAYDAQGAVLGGGSHSPRGPVTELTGIAVLPVPGAAGSVRRSPRPSSRTPTTAMYRRCSSPRRTTRSPGSTSAWASSGSGPRASPGRPRKRADDEPVPTP